MNKINNNLNSNIFNDIYFTAFNKKTKNLGIKKLSGGLKNRVYLLDDGKNRFVLKTEPSDASSIVDIDKNTLWWEAKILKELEILNVNIPHLIFYSDGIDSYPHPFLIMNYLDGDNYLNCRGNLSIEQKKEISYNIGELSKAICSIKKNKYYIPAFPNKKIKSNYEFVLFLFNILLKIYKRNKINIEGITREQIIALLKSKRKELNKVNSISLCNIDLWDGNILVKNGKISGVVDFTDTYYCDELMSFYFHLIDVDTDEYFLLGYGNKKITYDEKIRIEIYRLYVVLKMIVDCDVKQYGRFGKMYSDFVRIYKKIEFM